MASTCIVRSKPWHILGNFADDDAAPRTPELRHRLMFIILGAVLLVCAALLYKQPVSPVNAMISWPTAIMLSLVLAIGISQIWRVAMQYSSDKDRDTFAVTSTQAVAREARDYNQRAIDHLSEKPLVIAMTIAFFTLLISTRDKNRLDVLRTGVGFDIGISTSIFFVVVLSHIGLRERIVSEEVFYLEYFYLLMYANLIWICCHSILSGLNVQLLDKVTFGVSAKKAFFPVNFLLMFTFTWLIFYS